MNAYGMPLTVTEAIPEGQLWVGEGTISDGHFWVWTTPEAEAIEILTRAGILFTRNEKGGWGTTRRNLQGIARNCQELPGHRR